MNSSKNDQRTLPRTAFPKSKKIQIEKTFTGDSNQFRTPPESKQFKAAEVNKKKGRSPVKPPRKDTANKFTMMQRIRSEAGLSNNFPYNKINKDK